MGKLTIKVPSTPAREGEPYKVRLAPPRPKRVPKTFYQSIPGAFAYPFKKNGLKLLTVGTIIFGFFDFLANFRMGGYHVLSLTLGGLVVCVITGYLFLYLQSIINSSAMGDQEMPLWPEYENWWEGYGAPYVRLFAIVAACMAPAILGAMFLGALGKGLIIPLSILGFFYAPMALLAVALDDSLMGLNPLLVIPAITRVPVEYLVSCVLFGALFFVVGWSAIMFDKLLPQFVSQIAGMFFILYFCVVQMRLIGLLYHCKKDRFGWQR